MEIAKAHTGTEKKFWDMCLKVVRDLGFRLYDLEYLPGQKLLRLYIMQADSLSATIDDCVKVDGALTPFFETEEWMPAEVTLEVGSPGVYRHVNSLAHFQMGVGEIHAVTIMGQLPSAGNESLPKKTAGAKKFRGILKEAGPLGITLVMDEGEVKIPFSVIKNAQVDPDFRDLINKAETNTVPH